MNPIANPPHNPETNQPVQLVPERINLFLASLKASDTLIISTPVLAEVLVRAGDGAPGILEALAGMGRIKVKPFGQRAAVETAMMTQQAIDAGDKKAGSGAPWQKVKVDRQIIAVARVEGATAIYSDDGDLIAFAKALGMEVVSTWTLPLPESEANLFSAMGLDDEPI